MYTALFPSFAGMAVHPKRLPDFVAIQSPRNASSLLVLGSLGDKGPVQPRPQLRKPKSIVSQPSSRKGDLID